VLVLAVAGYNLLPKAATGPGATPSVIPSLAPTPTIAPASPTPAAISCANGSTGCLGTLTGGTYSSTNFAPKVTFTVPAGPASGPPASYWRNSVDVANNFTLVPNGGGNRFAFQVVSNVAIPAQTQPTCEATEQAGVGNAVADWVTFLTENPALEADAPVAVTVSGYDGFRVDFERAADWTTACPNSLGGAVLLWMHAGRPDLGVQMMDDQVERFYIVDVAGETVLITVESGSTTGAASDRLEAQAIIDSFVFTP
jgi:hypothetical protein